MRTTRYLWFLVVLSVVLLTTSAPTITLASSTADEAPPPVGRCEDPEAVLDEAVMREMEESDLPGLVLSLVAGGEVVVGKGYGYADVETGVRIDPAKTSSLQ